MTFPGIVYLLCPITCTMCATMLVRAWVRARTPLLLCAAASLSFLALNNVLAVADLLLFLDVDLMVWRRVAALAAGGTLIVGFIWEAE